MAIKTLFYQQKQSRVVIHRMSIKIDRQLDDHEMMMMMELTDSHTRRVDTLADLWA